MRLICSRAAIWALVSIPRWPTTITRLRLKRSRRRSIWMVTVAGSEVLPGKTLTAPPGGQGQTNCHTKAEVFPGKTLTATGQPSALQIRPKLSESADRAGGLQESLGHFRPIYSAGEISMRWWKMGRFRPSCAIAFPRRPPKAKGWHGFCSLPDQANRNVFDESCSRNG